MNSDQEHAIANLARRVAMMESQVAGLYKHLNLSSNEEASVASVPPPPLPAQPDLEILSVDAKPTESNSVWTKWSWRLKVNNRSSRTIVSATKIEFRDRESFAIDNHHSEPSAIRPGEQTLTGFHMVNASIAHLVNSIYATLTPLN